MSAGVTQLAECLLPKQNVVGSNPITRSISTATSQIWEVFCALKRLALPGLYPHVESPVATIDAPSAAYYTRFN